MTLADALAGLPPSESEWDGRVSLGLPDAALTLDALAEGGTALDALVAAKRNGVKGGDDKLGCAYLTGELSWTLGKLLGGLWLTGWHVQHANPATIAITLRPVSWVENGDCRISQVIDLHIDPSGLTCGSDDPQHLARAMVDLHQGVITALSRSTGLGQAAQWRLVGDGLSGALLESGKALGRLPRAIDLGRSFLADRASRLSSPQTEFIEVYLPGPTLSDSQHAGDWFLLRGGCCRFYTSENGEYCTTCVLRKREDQITRLQAYLGELAAAGHCAE